MAIEKIARNAVTTSSLPPRPFLTSVGSTDSITAPTSQNQLTTMPPHHSRGLALSSPSRRNVEARIFGLILRSGARASGRRNEARRRPAAEREHHHHAGEGRRIAAVLGREPADNRAGEDCEKCRGFDQRVAGGKFGGREMIRQDAVLDRAEQRRNDAEQKQREKQQRDRVQPEAGDRAVPATPISTSFSRCGDVGLVEPVGDLAAERRQDEERKDENRAGERNQRFGIVAGQFEQDQEYQRVLEEIVVERAEKLAPEQRRETPSTSSGWRTSDRLRCVRMWYRT